MYDTSERFLIKGTDGARVLVGTIRVNGAKNAALKAFAASLLFSDPVTLKNIPHIEDIERITDLLLNLGTKITKNKDGVFICDHSELHTSDLSHDISKRLRASIVVTGPLLARTGKVSFPHPGGCVIGARPIDLFLEGFQKMGARIIFRDGTYHIVARGGKLRGAELFFRAQSVTGTETFMMAAILAEGKTVIKNAAMEPEIKHLADFLISCGARIKGAGTPAIEITGGTLLRAGKKTYITPPDRIEAGSFLILGALAAKDLKITNCDPTHIEALLEVLDLAGVHFRVGKDFVHIKGNSKRNAYFKNTALLKTHEYPGFPTDLQAPMMIFLTQASGESLVFETIFEGRLNYVEELVRMGADIRTMDPHRVIVKGHTSLKGREMESPDLRAGLAFVIAGVVARGRSVIHNVYNIDRGYERVEERLRGIGVDIKRVRE